MTQPRLAEKRLFLLDGMALIYRAHFALIRSPRYTSGGLCTSAVFGLSNSLFDLINREQPTHLAAVFDTEAPTHRHEEFAEYKATREEMPEDLSEQVPYVFRLLETLHVPIIRIDGYEADDIIGTLALQASDNGFESFMVTPDKDFDQLVRDGVYVYKPGRQGSTFEIFGVPEVLEKWQIERVDQVIDILGLMGDTSDNVPGVPGIGIKTAQKLIARFGSIDELLQNLDQLKGKQKERLLEHQDQARLSRQLVTILTNVPHDVDVDSLAVQPYDEEALQSLFGELEFQTLGKRLFGESFSPASTRAAVIREERETQIQTQLFPEATESKTIGDVPHRYHAVRTQEERAELIRKLEAQSAFCFDTETTGIDPRSAEPLGIAFSWQPHCGYYVVLPDEQDAAQSVLDEFRELFSNTQTTKIGHNLKYDLSVLRWHGLEVRGPTFDTMLAHTMKEPEMKHGLDYLADVYLGYQPVSITELIGERGEEQRSMRDVPLEQLVEYACEDADVTLQLYEILREEIKTGKVAEVCHEVEFPLTPVLVDMEYQGIRLDTEALAKFSDVLEREIETLRNQIFAAAGYEFNIDSPKQLGVVLFEDLKIDDKPKKTPTGQYSTREAELLRLSGRHPMVQDVLEYRNAVKLKSVYVDQLPAAVNPNTGRVHTHYDQAWTATGRMQSNDPNLQTIPIRKQRGREIRAAFVPRSEEYLLLAADYSQIELRLMAELSGDASMMEAFVSDTDIHTVTASKVFKVELEDVTREMRDKAKTVNFGIIYGISAFGLQQRLNIPRAEAHELIDNYFAKYPGVQEYIDRTIAFARQNGYVETVTGRRRYLRDINSRNGSVRSAAERLAMNSPLQGTAADMLKMAMSKVFAALREGDFQTKMLLTVHDELVFDMRRDEQSTVMPVIEQAMRTALPLKVPIVVEMGVGENWLEAH